MKAFLPCHTRTKSSPTVILVWLLASGSVFAAPLSFESAIDIAGRLSSPWLGAASAREDARQEAILPAGQLPDPKLVLGLESYPVTGPNAGTINQDDFTGEKIGLLQEFPNQAKRRARTDAAKARLVSAEQETNYQIMRVRRETAVAWTARYYLESKLKLYDELQQENDLLTEAVHAQLAAGGGMTTDTLIPKQEAALLAEQRDEVLRDIAVAKSALVRWVGTEGNEPLAGAPFKYKVDPLELQQHVEHHPEVLLYESLTAETQAEVNEAAAAKLPDWDVELGYLHRNPDFGDLLSLQVSIDLPLFPDKRQTPAIASKQAELLRLEAERTAKLREQTEAYISELAEFERVERAWQRQQNTLLPLAQEKVELTFSNYRIGLVDLPTLISARRELIAARLKLIELESQHAQLAARLVLTYGGEY